MLKPTPQLDSHATDTLEDTPPGIDCRVYADRWRCVIGQFIRITRHIFAINN